MKSTSKLSRLLVATSAAVFSSSAALGQSYPSKPISIISTSPVGNSGDVSMRLVIPLMNASLGQPLIMDNRTAAGGQVASLAVKNAPPDGYTFLHMNPSFISAIFLVKQLPYDGRKDFSPVSRLITVPSLWAVSADLPVNNMSQFIEYAKRNPGKIAYGSTGIGSGFHMIGEAFSLDMGVSMLHVPYGQGGVAVPITDLANNRLQLYFPSYTSLLPVLKTGNVKVLAVVDRSRLKVLPDVPTIFESLPDYTLLASFFGLVAPAGTPSAVTHRFQSELKRALQLPEVATKLEGLGSTPVGNTPEEFAEEMRVAIDNFGKVVRSAGIPAQ